ncbi:Dabb family protein [Nocardia sp. NPDC005366]|uniref:Dabb family protein n=1 Tax=Nocardia sp. NPDC005366 TaxID=3156878 RepID=UPI0033B7D37E
MYKVTRLLHMSDPADEPTAARVLERITAAAESTPAGPVLVARTLPGVRNGGDIVAHFQFASAPEWARCRASIDEATSGPQIRHVDSVEYVGGSPADGRAGRRRSSRPSTIYRILLLRVEDSAAPAELDRFEHATAQMPEHISAIQAWQLSRVCHAEGTSRWTHVWEQEFTDVDALLGPYMNHPVHWGHVDRWFDPECPEQIVKDRVCHSFCELPVPVIDTAPAIPLSAEER